MSIPTVDVQIWSDVMCPWCAIGYAQYEKALAELDGEIDVATRWMPFELNPDMAPEGKSQAQHLAETYNRSDEEVAEMRRRLSEAASRAGFPMQFDGPAGEPGMMWNTFAAHKLLRWALALQGPEAQTRLSMALFRAHFQERLSIGDREVLLDIAEAEGFDRGAAAEALDEEALGLAVRLEEKRGLEAGINSVPSFVVNGKYLIPGAQEPEVFAATLRRVAALATGAERLAVPSLRSPFDKLRTSRVGWLRTDYSWEPALPFVVSLSNHGSAEPPVLRQAQDERV